MKRYVLGPSSARGLKKLLTGEMLAGRGAAARQGVIDDAAFPLPFTVQWASSLANTTSGSETSGEWIIYLPGTVHVVCNDTSINLATAGSLEAAGGDYPTGWFKLGNTLMPRETGGDLYVNVNTESKTAVLANSGSSAYVSVKIATTAVSSTTTARTVKQFYLGTLVVGGGDGEGEEYGCDEWSVSDLGDEQHSSVNAFYIAGFGRFYPSGSEEPYGVFSPSSELTISEDSATEVAFLVRTGNRDQVAYNSIGYRTLKLTHSGSSPFEYTKTTTGSGSSELTTYKLVNCSFYWNGELQTLADYDCSSVIANGTIYLTATQAAPSAAAPDPAWTFALAAAAATAPSGGKVLNWKLYDFAQSKVTVDYRTSFLALEDTTQKAKVTVAKPGSSTKIELDASGSTPKVVVTDGTKSVTIDLGDIPAGCSGGVFKLHNLEFKDKDGNAQVYHGLFCSDIDLEDIKGTGDQADWNETSSSDPSYIQNKPNLNLDVVTGVTMSKSSTGITMTVSKVNLLTGVTSSTTTAIEQSGTEVDVVTGSTYDTNTHKFVNTKSRLTVLGTGTASPATEDVFTATPHSSEV